MLARKMTELGTEDVDKAYSELVADACESLLLDSNAANVLAELASKDKGLVAKIKRFFEDILNKLRKYYKGLEPQSAEGRLTRELARECEEIYRMFEDALKGAVENFQNAEVVKSGKSSEVQKQAKKNDRFAEYDKPITMEDVKLLRSITAAHNGERVSINDFTAEDIEKAQKWAYKFYKELGVKSPFFRAWFGDWRTESQEDAKVVDKIGEQRNPSVNNKDTNWNIIVSRQVSKETNHHSGDSVKNAIKYLPYIVDITENAVLFDTVISSQENPLSLMYHTMYAYTEVMGYPALLKLKVEELINEKDGSPIRRDYILQNVKEESISIGKRFSKAHLHEKDSSTISISDLFELVKTYDPEFKPHPVHESMIDNGQPKVFYHGSPAQFTAFDKKKARSMGHYGRGFYFSDSKSHAGTYGNTYSVYLNIANPLKKGESKVSRDQVRSYLERIAENEDYSIENYGTYDVDTILDRIFEGANEKDAFAVIQDINATAIGDMVEAAKLFNEVNGTSFDGIIVPTETVAFEPEQIKSATRDDDLANIGTFSKYEADIQFQRKKVYATEIEEGVFRYNGVIYDTNKIRTDLLDNYTEKDYNRYAWAVVNGIVKEEEIVEFRKRLAEIWQGSHDKKINVVRLPGTLATFYFRGGFTSPIIEAAYNGVDGYEEYLTAEDYPKIEKEIRKYGQKRAYSAANESIGYWLGERVVFGYGKTDCPSYGQLKEFRENGGRAYFGSLFGDDGQGSFGSDQDSEVNTDLQFQQKLPSDRVILANALESTIDEASDPKSADIIKRYKAQINTITEAEKRLGEVNEAIKSLAFAKGKRDLNKLRVLQDEKAELVKKIDRFDKSLLRLEATSFLKDVLTREKAKERAKTNAKAKEKLSAFKERATAREEAIVNKFREANERGREKRNKTVVRNKIRKTIGELDKLFSRGTKEKNVKAGMRDTVATALASAQLLFADDITNEMIARQGFNVRLTDTENNAAWEYTQILAEIDEYRAAIDTLNNGDEIGKDEKIRSYRDAIWTNKQKLKKLDKVLEDAFKSERKQYYHKSSGGILRELANTYAKTKNASEDYLRAAYKDTVRVHIEQLADYLEEAEPIIRDMSLDTLKKVYRAYRMVLTSVQRANKTFKYDKNSTVATLGNEMMDEVVEVGGENLTSLGGKVGELNISTEAENFGVKGTMLIQ